MDDAHALLATLAKQNIIGTVTATIAGHTGLILEDTGTDIPALIAALENLSAAQVTTAIKAMTGITVGGTWTFAKWCAVIAAALAGDYRLKSDSSAQEILDAESGTDLVITETHERVPAAGGKYKDVTVEAL